MQRFLALQVHGSEAGRATLATLRHQLYARGEPSRDALADSLRLLAATDLRGEVGAIVAPALVVSGERDTLAPAGAGAWLGAALPNATYVRIDGRRARAVPVAPCGVRSRARRLPRWLSPRPSRIRARPTRARCAARSAARRRATTQPPRCSAR
jgi:hypothetical protein